jgi:hypothetical protein
MLRQPPESGPPGLNATSLGTNSAVNPLVKDEDLGTRQMEGVEVHGVRETQTVSEASTGKSVVVTDEYWYSDALRLNMLIKHDDPRTGEQTTTVTQVSRSEPDAAIFEIPADYKLLHPRAASGNQ